MITSARFTMINESFTCDHCHEEVPFAAKTCRNHCPYCLRSKHVDMLPGDRQNPCGGLMDPIMYEVSRKKGIILSFKCRLCEGITRNKAILEDTNFPDDYNAILKINS